MKLSLRRLFGIAISSLSIAWLAFLIWQELPEVYDGLRSANIGWAMLSLLLVSASLLPSVLIFESVLTGHDIRRLSRRQMTRLVLTSQVVRYMPGRFWGVAYLVNEARPRIEIPAMLRANVDFIAISLGINGAVGLSLWAFAVERHLMAIAILVVGMSLVVGALRHNWIGGVFRLLANVLPGRVGGAARHLSSGFGYRWDTVRRVILLKSLTWMLYVAAWVVLGWAFPLLDGVDMVLLCGVYTVAWVIGFLTIITPGGLGIRELVFYSLVPSQEDVAAIAFVAIFVRFWLMISEMLLGVGALLMLRKDRVEA